MHIYNEWLPPGVAARAAATEPQRFHSLVSALLAAQKRGDVTAALQFVSPLISFIDGRTELEAADVNAAAKAALQLLFSCRDNLVAQVSDLTILI